MNVDMKISASISGYIKMIPTLPNLLLSCCPSRFTLPGCPSRSAPPALVVLGLAGAFRLNRQFRGREIRCNAGKCRSHHKSIFKVIQMSKPPFLLRLSCRSIPVLMSTPAPRYLETHSSSPKMFVKPKDT